MLALCLATCSPALLAAQAPQGDAGVRGLVVTAGDQPVPLAIVELRTRADSAALRTIQTHESGRFQLDGVAAGVYHLLIRSIGYGVVRTVDFTVVAGQVRDLGMVRLESMAVQLDPVVVTVERPDIVFEPDRTSYLVEALAGATGGVINDVLRGMPDLAVDFDGTVRLRGVTPTIYINGRPAPMGGMSLAAFMEQFPADRIERIEILDAPPARFSAEGAAGIINIVLKEGVSLGVTGSVSASAGTRGQRTAGGRATMQRGPWIVNGGLNVRWSDSESADLTLRQNLLTQPVTFLRQDARSSQSSRSGGGSMDLRYDFSRRSRLSLGGGFNLNGNDRNGLTETAHLDQHQQPTLRYHRLADNATDGRSWYTSAGYEYSWQPQRHLFSVEFNAGAEASDGTVRDEIEADPAFGTLPPLPWLTRRTDDNTSTRYSLDARYVHPWGGQGRIEFGSAARWNESVEEQRTGFFEALGAPVPDRVEDRAISREQHTMSAYLTVQRRFGRFGAVAGLRGEFVASDVVLPSGAPLEWDEGRFFPSLNLNWNPRQGLGLRIGYSRRTNRPGVSILDPTNRSTDPLNRSVGNPEIRSSITHNINTGVSWTGRLGQFSAGPYWSRTIDGWERITTVDAEGISTTTWANLTSQENLGSSVNWGLPRVRGWRAQVNASASRSMLHGSIRSRDLRNGRINWSAGANVDGTILGTLMAQGSFGYQPPRDLAQGRSSGQWRADFSFRHRLPDSRTTISLSVQDPFELRRTTRQIRDPSVIQTGSSRMTTRSVSLNASYAFGRAGPRR